MIGDWVPPALKPVLSNLRYQWAHPEAKRMLAGNRELKGRYAGRKRCFVIGNGPSLKTQDIRPLKDEIVIVANSFFQHPDASYISPAFCCVADSAFIEDKPHAVAWLRKLEAGLPDTAMCFSPEAQHLFKKHGLFSRHRVYYLRCGSLVSNARRVRIDFTRLTNVGHSTGTTYCIPLALYLGFREIYLIGFDANWTAAIEQGPVHFYETNVHFPHFDKSLVAGESMEDHLQTSYLEFRSHRFLREKAETMGVRIMNATNGGFLDMYPRVKYESLLAAVASP